MGLPVFDKLRQVGPSLAAGRRKFRWPAVTIDLSRSKHRSRIFFGSLAVFFLTGAFLVGGFEVYHWTESTEFCADICHPMQSVAVRHELSPHSNVECARCHIGPGVMPFIEAKLNGTKELYMLLTDTYHRPIRSPVQNLRPAREICEECHAPSSFQDNIIKIITHYDNDEANTPIQSTLILKMGGWHEDSGVADGIHWHITNRVYYVAADDQRQVILWVGSEQEDGTLKEFYFRDMLNMPWNAFVGEARVEGEVRLMDCIDCHNRAAHHIPEPSVSVDEAIEAGLISRDLPYIRAKAVEVLIPLYETTANAHAAIDGLADFYRTEYPEVYESLRAELDAAIAALKEIDAVTKFPDVELDWQASPNNERHNPTAGCFRCHDGKHVSVDETGNQVEVISVKCNLCHTVPIVGRGADMLFEAPVVVGPVPDSHSDFRWTIEHRSTTEDEEEVCYTCHGHGFCNNSVCHNFEHPPDMMFTHSDQYRKTDEQVCYSCHQDVLCSRCHAGGVVVNP